MVVKVFEHGVLPHLWIILLTISGGSTDHGYHDDERWDLDYAHDLDIFLPEDWSDFRFRGEDGLLNFVISKGCHYLAGFIKSTYTSSHQYEDGWGNTYDQFNCDIFRWTDRNCRAYSVPKELCCGVFTCGPEYSAMAFNAPQGIIDRCRLNMTSLLVGRRSNVENDVIPHGDMCTDTGESYGKRSFDKPDLSKEKPPEGSLKEIKEPLPLPVGPDLFNPDLQPGLFPTSSFDPYSEAGPLESAVGPHPFGPGFGQGPFDPGFDQDDFGPADVSNGYQGLDPHMPGGGGNPDPYVQESWDNGNHSLWNTTNSTDPALPNVNFTQAEANFVVYTNHEGPPQGLSLNVFLDLKLQRWCSSLSRKIRYEYHFENFNYAPQNYFWIVDVYRIAVYYRLPSMYTHSLVGCGFEYVMDAFGSSGWEMLSTNTEFVA